MSTSGEVITYDGEVALAVFHSQSAGGRTESSAQVWGGEVPYLVSVESHGEETAPNFYSSVEVSFDEFCKKLKENNPAASITSVNDIGKIEMSDGGNVRSITIGGAQFQGKDIRSIFNLRSSCFTIDANESKVTFLVMGYGHGVGMSQYGANTMAKEGYSYKDILSHYYTGTKVEGV
jgi:stage II sporulation protein D